MWKLSKTTVAIFATLGISILASSVGAVESKISGDNHTLFVHNGNVYGIGENKDGEIDQLANTEYRTAKYLNITNVKSVTSTMRRNAILTYDGKVTLRGRRSSATANASKVPYGLPIASTDVVQDIALGLNTVWYIVNGIVYSWDYTATGKPVVVSSSTLGTAKSVAAGTYHAVILYTDGTVGAVGSNVNGQLGIPSAGRVITAAKKIDGVTNIKSIAAGEERSFLVTNYGDVYAFGRNSRGELGLGDKTNRTTPTLVPIHNVDKIVTGTTNTVAMLTGGRWLISGWHDFIDAYFDLSSLQFVQLTGTGYAADVGIAGDANFVNYGQSGTMTIWGGNYAGKLGDGTNTERNTFGSMQFTKSARNATSL